jgi:hypothetical protein
MTSSSRYGFCNVKTVYYNIYVMIAFSYFFSFDHLFLAEFSTRYLYLGQISYQTQGAVFAEGIITCM